MTTTKTHNQANFYVTEFLKCKKNFDYFCTNYIIIELPGGDVKLKPYNAQSKLIKTINKDNFVLVLKSRQIGISTITQAYSVWLTIFYDNAVIGIISKDGPEATSFARSIASMIDNLPAWMKPKGGQQGAGFKKRSEQSFILTNGSKCYAATVNPKAPSKTLRGKSITFLIIDEAAFIEHLDEAWTSMIPALSTNQKHAKAAGVPYGILCLSTPNKTVGIGAWFYKKYKDSVSGDSILKNFVIHWKDIPELANDPNWYKTQCDLFDNDSKKINQELELKFVATEGTFFDEKTTTKLQEGVITPSHKSHTVGGEIWRWEEPIQDRFYLIGVDTATEYGIDKSAITIWDFQSLEQVWEYQGKLEIKQFIQVVELACGSYPGMVVVENNSYGEQVVKHLRDSDVGYNLYHEKYGKKGLERRPGLTTTAKTRPLMIESLYTYITQHPESVKSERLVLELVGLIEKTNGRVEGDTGCTDDLVMSSALSFYVRKYDAPMMLETPQLFQGELIDVMELNDDSNWLTSEMSNREMSNKIIKGVKNGEFEQNQGKAYVNILDILYDRK